MASQAAEMKIRAIAPWFGAKRTLAPRIVTELGPHVQYFEPFCGSMAVLFAKPPSQKETVCDLHGDLTNLARVIRCPQAAPRLYERLTSTLFCEALSIEAGERLSDEFIIGGGDGMGYEPDEERAYWFFLACWMTRNGTAGTLRADYQVAVRWTKNGGSPTTQFRNCVESIPAWHERLRNVVILNRDAFSIMDRFEDDPETAIYADPPYPSETRSGWKGNGSENRYLHEFEHNVDPSGDLFAPQRESPEKKKDHHVRLAEILRNYKRARIVVSTYECERYRRLYEGWRFVSVAGVKQLSRQNERGGGDVAVAPELLICNF